MGIEQIEGKIRRDPNNAICLIGIIPLLIFFFLIVQRSSSLNVFVGSGGYMVGMAIAIFLVGLIAGRRIIVGLIDQLISVNRKIVQVQQELVEKKRTDAVVQTVIMLSHEISTPLMTMIGSIELAKNYLKNGNENNLRDKLSTMKNQCDTIVGV